MNAATITSIKNYTSEVSVERSVGMIEHELVRAGATHIAKWYDDAGNLDGIMFELVVNKWMQTELPLHFKLPSKWKRCAEIFIQDLKKVTDASKRARTEQAQRTAWKLLYEWVAVQVSMIRLDQAEAVEVFLPYVFNGATQKTLFESVKDGGMKLLTGTVGD